MKQLSKLSASWVEVTDAAAGQRLDNFLLRTLKGVPKSHVYRLLRGGEVRLNSRRAEPGTRLAAGDRVRLPPVRRGEPGAGAARGAPPGREFPVLFEDEHLLAIAKPAGVAVHGGSGVAHGVVEQLRASRPEGRFLELVHRLDRDTSGVLLLAKKRSALTALHAQLRGGSVRKEYLVLVRGRWSRGRRAVEAPLTRFLTGEGERRVRVDPEGAPSRTVFTPLRELPGMTLLRARLETGRTHQIRVHLSHLGHPIAGDDKYGDFEWNRALAREGLKRMFLHAESVEFEHPASGARVRLEAPLPPELAAFAEAAASAGRAASAAV